MSKLRNPFRLRASEKIESDSNFLKLYNPTVLEALQEFEKNGKLWNNVIYIHSSPGAGKTSLLRIFEPNTLSTLLNNKTATEYKTLFSILRKLGVVDDNDIKIMGVSLVCTRNYEILEELDVSAAQKKRYFFSLLNARIVLSALKTLVGISKYNRSFSDTLETITYHYEDKDNYFRGIEFPCNGRDLYNWASEIERKVYEAIDSFLPVSEIKPIGHDELFSMEVLKPENFTINEKHLDGQFLFMLDDAHKLSSNQRQSLKKYLIEKRGNFNVWISERLEALDPVDNLRSFEERDYEELNIEKFWSDKPEKFEKILSSIAEKRAATSTEEVTSFSDFLRERIEEQDYQSDLMNAIEKSTEYFTKIKEATSKFDQWISYVESQQLPTLEKAILYKKLEILIVRTMNKQQLAFEFPLTEQELFDKMKSEMDGISKLFISNENAIPYYYGFNDLVKLASNNIEQFLTFSANLFEEMLSNKLGGYQTDLEAKDQQRILKEVANSKWVELSKLLPFSDKVIQFLTRLGDFCFRETYRPNAPYREGVTGFAIKDHLLLFRQSEEWYEDSAKQPLIDVLSTCVAFNLLEIKKIKQGSAGEINHVFYLNRWLCLRFNLSFAYGGWRHKSSDELYKWTKV
ncbi:hypothetical protein M3B46_13300 [Sphingobacterium daejeonense]|uniref:ORC-CDC6 family AAA ATPase n=1 Tax=Sphingobacterium daejeonense TaxID=371142 RepID=UPI0021A4F73B|nr:hypothetical protein [Sphingobacterium daejeonense]MCT1531973.1 hypothetical protein [Sphingobacterium daejeonense]